MITGLARAAAIAAAATLALAACTGDGEDPPSPTASDTPTSTATASPSESAAPSTTTPPSSGRPAPSTAPPAETEEPPSDDAPFPADLLDDTADASGDASLSPTNIRFGAHDGYDRIVIDFAGEGTPGWLGRYVEEARQAGSGDPVELAGDYVIQVSVTGVVYPIEEGASAFVGDRDFEPASGTVIEQVVYGSIFEGQAEVYIGLSAREPFRVFLLEDPTRVVIDVQHP